MTTKINSSSAGLTETVDATGILEIQTANVTAVIIDASQNANFTSTGAITVSVGTTAQRPTGSNGMIRYNSNLTAFEYYVAGAWAIANVTPPPVNTVAPVVSGSTAVGGTANVTNGTWNYSPTGYYYQWLANSVAISTNATSNTFVITLTQNGANLSCNVTAYNAAGNSSPATSNSVGPVTSTYSISYLVVAGGGGGTSDIGSGGAGGAGGYLANTATLTSGNVYTTTVGGGGGGSTNGSNSSITGTGVSVTSIGGGKGGPWEGGAGSSGGSGGGGASIYAGGGGAGGAGTAGQGNNGASGNSFPYGGGGGGGAGAAGSSRTGGAGLSSSITGSSVTRAVGGTSGNGSSGGANTGNGGSSGSGSGGSGVVILSIPTASYSGTTTGSPGVTTSGGNTILTYNSSGTYTA